MIAYARRKGPESYALQPSPNAAIMALAMEGAHVGRPAPAVELVSVGPHRFDGLRVTVSEYRGRWLLLLFYPRDFSFVCPTELVAFSNRFEDFAERGCDLLAVSVDSIETHRQWMRAPASEGGVAGIRFPIASDPGGDTSRRYGVLDDTGVALRGLFIIDPAGVLQYAVVHNLAVGRSTDEVLRVLDALRAGGLCAAGWTRADGTIDPRLDLVEGRVLGNCRLEGLLGEGGFGWVYSAWDLRLDRRVAVKIGRTIARSTRDRALREARAAARLSHPSICAIYSVEELAGVPIVVMEHLPGGSLAERLRNGRFEEKEASRVAAQVLDALAASHRAGIVHGDIKPANILFAGDGTAKVADFGMAHSPDLPAESSEAIGGTPAYMAPEQIEGAPPSAASDVFSAGLLVFEVSTGERVARGDIRAVFDTLRSLDPGGLALRLPERYRDTWCRMVALEPQQRPSVAEVAQSWAV
jgi:alkyl hydroperoxide reductase subunit AhpC